MARDIAAVVNLHREGRDATPSIISAWRALETVTRHGLSGELVLVLDRSDSATSKLAEHWRSTHGATVLRIDEGDLGQARNHAVATCDAQWVAFLDGDDLWGEEWLIRAHAAATSAPPRQEPSVWHPQLNVVFGDHHSIVHHIDSTDSTFSWSRFRLHNQWTALSFARRSDLAVLPYPSNDLEHGFGYEDWSWNEEVLRRGGRHLVVEDTCHFIKRSHGPSLLSASRQALRTRYSPTVRDEHLVRAPEEQPIASDCRATHEVRPLQLSRVCESQVRMAAAIEPLILETVALNQPSLSLPQNLQTHVTTKHLALAQIEHLRLQSPATMCIADLLKGSTRLIELSRDDRVDVVAEVLLDPELHDRPVGESPWIDETLDAFPQIQSASGNA